MSFDWNDESVALLKRRWAERAAGTKVSASEIGKELGTSRNAVLGKLHRLGLLQKDPERIQRLRTALSRAPVAAPPKDPDPTPWRGGDVPEDLEEEPFIERDEPAGRGLTLIQLRPRSCRWPLGDPTRDDFRFCGDPTITEGSSYCEEHARIAFVSAVKRVRKA